MQRRRARLGGQGLAAVGVVRVQMDDSGAPRDSGMRRSCELLRSSGSTGVLARAVESDLQQRFVAAIHDGIIVAGNAPTRADDPAVPFEGTRDPKEER
jgi:hypothetical protein